MKETLSAVQGSDEKRSPKRGDLILIAALLAVGLVLLFTLRICREEGAFAVVELDGREVGRYSLSLDGEYPLNGGSNILVIEDGSCFLSYADCPDKVCVNTGSIRYRGQSIVCLPNRLTVRIEGDGGGADLVS